MGWEEREKKKEEWRSSFSSFCPARICAPTSNLDRHSSSEGGEISVAIPARMVLRVYISTSSLMYIACPTLLGVVMI